MKALLEVQSLDVAIGATRVCTDLGMRILPGQSWALLGRNGVGKTTLLHHLAGLRRGSSGSIRLDGVPLGELDARHRARGIAVLLQHSSRGFGASVLETVLSGRHPHLGRFAWEGGDDLAIAERCIAAVDLSGLAERPLTTLSGGELRRVEIARLLAQDCPLSLLDEPLNHLDFAHQAAMLRLLGDTCVGAGRAMLMVIHDLNAAYRACDHWLVLGGDGGWRAGSREAMADPALLSTAFGHPIERIETVAGDLFRPQI